MGRLEDLRVERVDGVDRPATGHRFVIVKSARNATQLLKELESAELTDEQRELVTELASTLKDDAAPADDSGEDAPKGDEPADDEDVEKDETVVEDAPAAGIYDEQLLAALSSDEGKALLKGVIADVVDDELAELDEGTPVSKSARLRSRQPRKQDEGEQPRTVSKSKGEGMFSNIIFGQDRR